MGGLGHIFYSAKSRYADDHGICGTAREEFLSFLQALDDEYIAYVSEKQKAEAEAEKNKAKN